MLHRLNPDVLKVRGEAYKEMGLDPKELETDLETLRVLMKTADYPKFWRDRLIAIAYSPLTRVDLRRIYELGLIDDEELKARLMELGYTKKDAELMLQFYKAYRNVEERDLTKTEILKGYRMGSMTKEQAKEMLMDLGYSEEEAEFILELEDYKKWRDEVDEQVDLLMAEYKEGLITKDELAKGLESLNLSEKEKEYWLRKADVIRARERKRATPSDWRRWFEAGVVDEVEFRKRMEAFGYTKEEVDYFVAEGRKKRKR